jgi:hypothetical protein
MFGAILALSTTVSPSARHAALAPVRIMLLGVCFRLALPLLAGGAWVVASSGCSGSGDEPSDAGSAALDVVEDPWDGPVDAGMDAVDAEVSRSQPAFPQPTGLAVVGLDPMGAPVLLGPDGLDVRGEATIRVVQVLGDHHAVSPPFDGITIERLPPIEAEAAPPAGLLTATFLQAASDFAWQSVTDAELPLPGSGAGLRPPSWRRGRSSWHSRSRWCGPVRPDSSARG